MQLTFLMQIYYSFEKNIGLNKKRKKKFSESIRKKHSNHFIANPQNISWEIGNTIIYVISLCANFA